MFKRCYLSHTHTFTSHVQPHIHTERKKNHTNYNNDGIHTHTQQSFLYSLRTNKHISLCI